MPGRPPKPTAIHIAEGTFDGRRHEDRADVLYPDDVPEQIRGLGTDGCFAYKMIVGATPTEILHRVDSLSLFMMCRLWARWRKADRDDNWPIMRQTGEQLTKLMIQFGLTPVSRCRIMAPGASKQESTDDLRREFLG